MAPEKKRNGCGHIKLPPTQLVQLKLILQSQQLSW